MVAGVWPLIARLEHLCDGAARPFNATRSATNCAAPPSAGTRGETCSYSILIDVLFHYFEGFDPGCRRLGVILRTT